MHEFVFNSCSWPEKTRTLIVNLDPDLTQIRAVKKWNFTTKSSQNNDYENENGKDSMEPGMDQLEGESEIENSKVSIPFREFNGKN